MSFNSPTLNKVLNKILVVVNSKPIVAIKEGFMLTMPLTIIGSVFLLFAFIPVVVFELIDKLFR